MQHGRIIALMLADSLDLIAAVALFAAAVGAWWLSAALRSRERLYLRFAAVLLAALAVSSPFGLADVTVLFLLPLAAGALMVSTLAGVLPVGLAALALVLALAGGLAALVTGLWLLALLPVVLVGLAVMAAAVNSLALMPVLAGASLLAAGLVFVEQGARAGLMLFAAAALIGLTRLQLLRSSSSAMRPRRAVP
jgi:hypothetical protein